PQGPGGLSHSNQTPSAIVIIVSCAPALAYSQNVISTSRRARWTTIRLATEPSSVRFPARVEDIARVSHARLGSASFGMIGLKTSTAGTLLTRFDKTA